jgi:hypothetical protein
MAITSIKTGSSFTNLVKYNDFLAGNPAFFPSSYESIASTTTSSSVAEFAGIAGTYKHLQLRAIYDSGGSGISIQFNNDTAGNYAVHDLFANGSTVSARATTSASFILRGDLAYGGFPSSADKGVFIMDIIDYASTTKNKVARTFAGLNSNGGAAEYVGLGSGVWLNTSAITSIKINTSTTGTFSLYGIKG